MIRKLKMKFRSLSATLALLALITILFAVGALSLPAAFMMVLLWQAAMHCLSPRQAMLFMAALTSDQIEEFEEIMSSIKDYDGMFKDLARIAKGKGGWEAFRNLPNEIDSLRNEVKRLRVRNVDGSATGVRWIGNKAFVSDECARALTSTFVVECSRTQNALERLIKDDSSRRHVLEFALSTLSMDGVTKAALDSTTTPLPTVYVPQIVELVWHYGQARQFATVYPMGSGNVKLPKLRAGEDEFGYLGAGTAAGMSQNVPEKQVKADLVTFDANKAGGIIRIPSEIQEDTFIPFGQFLARYIARQLAKLEDRTLFLADGSGTYADQTGVGPFCVANPTHLQKLANGKTTPTDATINDFRAIRGKVNPAVLVDDPAYYMNPTMEALLVTFNTINNPLIYRPAMGPNQPATLDGFPIRWVGIMQPYSTGAAANAFVAMFGALSFWYMGERGTPRVELSRDVFFATDELAMRALERIDVNAMADDAMSALQVAGA